MKLLQLTQVRMANGSKYYKEHVTVFDLSCENKKIF